MVRTVPRSSVAKWPDSGATSSTRGCAASMSFLKCSSVPNGVTCAASSRTATSRLPTMTWVDAERRPRVGEAGARDQLVGGGQIAHAPWPGMPMPVLPNERAAMPAKRPDRRHHVGMGLIGRVQHSQVPCGVAAARHGGTAPSQCKKTSAFLAALRDNFVGPLAGPRLEGDRAWPRPRWRSPARTTAPGRCAAGCSARWRGSNSTRSWGRATIPRPAPSCCCCRRRSWCPA